MTTTTCPLCEADAEALPITGDWRPSPSRERRPASHYGQRFPLKLTPDHHRERHDLRRQAIAYEPWLAVGIGLATGAVLFAAGFAFAKLLGL
jgi:hypothetical protein